MLNLGLVAPPALYKYIGSLVPNLTVVWTSVTIFLKSMNIYPFHTSIRTCTPELLPDFQGRDVHLGAYNQVLYHDMQVLYPPSPMVLNL